MMDLTIYFNNKTLMFIFQLVLSIVLGFFVGLERRFREKEAGMRTHTIVCFGSALMMIISKYAFGESSDPSRVAAQIVAGIGFLGAGIIVYKKNVVYGLTTAAGIWTTAGIGMACGSGLYVVAIVATVFLILIHFCLHRFVFKSKKNYDIKVIFESTNKEDEMVREIFGVEKYKKLIIENKGEVLTYNVILNISEGYSLDRINQIIKENSFIKQIEFSIEN